MPRDYDDRTNPRFHQVQATLRRRMLVLAGVVAFSLTIAFVTIAQRGLSLSSPRDFTILVLLAFFSSLEVVALVLATREVFFVIAAGTLHYPRWGGIIRGSRPLSMMDAFYREGRDETVASVILLAGGKRFLVIPEHYLTDAKDFAEALRQSRVKEMPSRFRARSAG